jgi:hypothetical protein
MTLRARLAALTAAAVALAIVAASIVLWLLIRSSLLDEVDERLRERIPAADRVALVAQGSPPTGAPGAREGEVPTTRSRKSNCPAVTKQPVIAGSRITAALKRATMSSPATCGTFTST